eukprot:11396601-Ditylum_brightwellii.AAC.1
MGLLHVMVKTLNGKKNPKFPEKAMNFIIALDATSRKTCNFVSANFLGPMLCTNQQNNAKADMPLQHSVCSEGASHCLH